MLLNAVPFFCSFLLRGTRSEVFPCVMQTASNAVCPMEAIVQSLTCLSIPTTKPMDISHRWCIRPLTGGGGGTQSLKTLGLVWQTVRMGIRTQLSLIGASSIVGAGVIVAAVYLAVYFSTNGPNIIYIPELPACYYGDGAASIPGFCSSLTSVAVVYPTSKAVQIPVGGDYSTKTVQVGVIMNTSLSVSLQSSDAYACFPAIVCVRSHL